jgi:hypothetical protein
MRTTRVWFLLLGIGATLFAGLRMSADERPKEKSAKELAQKFIHAGAKKFGEDREGARMYQAKFTTPDDVGKVAGWYVKTLGTPADDEIAFNPGTQPGIRLSAADDSRQPGEAEQAAGDRRPLTLQVFVKKTNDVVVVAAVSRGQDEKRTHTTLTFLDNKAQ